MSSPKIIVSVLTLFMTIVFYTQCLITKDKDEEFVSQFQCVSETYVLGKILADKYSISSKKAGLGYFTTGPYQNTMEKALQSYAIISPDSYYITDPNWVKGISRFWAGFYDLNTEENNNLYQKGRTVKLSEADTRTITDVIAADPQYIHIHLSGNVLDSKTMGYPQDFKVYDNGSMIQRFELRPYYSNFGFQGRFFSFIYNQLGVTKINLLYIINIFLLSATLSFLCFLLAREYNFTLSAIFYLTFLASPWITAFSGNLYWVPFTWFLPAIFSLLLLRDKPRRNLYLPLIYLSVLGKSLCGYEYLSSILIFACLFWIVDLVTGDKDQRKSNLMLLTTIGVICILGFVSALLIHANMRGETIIDGLKQTWNQDILRRTYATNIANFEPMYAESLLASPTETVTRYFSWSTAILYGVSGKLFSAVVSGAFFILIYEAIKRRTDAKQDWTLFCVTLSCPLSWFILAKAHSYVHTHINFVLWYFGFIQIVFYIITKFILKELPSFMHMLRHARRPNK